MLFRKILSTLLLILAAAVAAPAQGIPRIEQDFVQWTQVVIDGNHPPGSNGYRDLAGLEEASFESAVEAFLAEDWALADERADDVGYQVVTFRDTGNGGEVFYGLIPEADNGDGRGFYFVRPRAQVQRRLVLQAPHAVEDNRTGVLGSEIFRASGARALMLTGADRCASSTVSGCTGDTDCGAHRVSDGAHAVNTFFQVFHRLASREHADTAVLQLHGFKVTVNSTTGVRDPEFSVSDGTTTDRASTTLANRFYQDLQNRISPVAGSSCNLAGKSNFKCGTDSVQGRDVNNSANACTTDAPTATDRFLHLEMSNDLREPGGLYETALVIDTVNSVIPRTAEVGDLIWADVDGDGVQEAGERGIHGVTVEVLDANGNVVEAGVTRVGQYRIGNLDAGTYRLRVQLPAGYTYGGGLDANTGTSGAFLLAAGGSLTSVDAALVPAAVGQVGDQVWRDDDGDGLRGAEDGAEGITVQLLAGDDVVDSATSDPQGVYEIANVPPGDYRLRVDPGAEGFTAQGAGLTDDDNEISSLSGTSADFSLAAGVTDDTRDVGLAGPCYDVDLVAPNSVWKWWTPGPADSVPSDWNQAGFTGDGAWNDGFSPLGFGTSRALTATTAPSAVNGLYTTYFRLPFEAADPLVFQGDLRLTLARNDGVIVYLNGVEILRRNLPWGAAVGAGTPASTKVDTIETVTIPAGLLQASNLLAVELHQSTENVSVGLFDLELAGKVCASCGVKEAVVSTAKASTIKLSSPGSNYGTNGQLEVDGGSGAKSALIAWDLSALPPGAEVLHAEMTMSVDDDSGASSDDPYAFHELLRSWNESGSTGATWNHATRPATTQTAWETAGATGANDSGAARLGLMPMDSGVNVDATVALNPAGRSVVEKWIDNPAANFGFLIDAEPGSTDGMDILSDDSGNAPGLRVIYVDPTCQP